MNRTGLERLLFCLPVSLLAVSLTVSIALMFAPAATADECPEEPPLQHYTGPGTIVCPCFIPGEEGGAVFTAPVAHYPIEILRVGIGWGSQFGGAPQSLEQSIHIYGAGLPNPGTPIFSVDGPLLTDGVINEFDLEPLPGEITVNSGPFAVTLEFLNENAGDPFAPSMVHDGNGCQAGKNVVFAIPIGWYDACVLGVSGDWVVYAIYRQVNCTGVNGEEEWVASNRPAVFMSPRPNPFQSETKFEFALNRPERVDLSVYDVSGRLVTTLAAEEFSAGLHWRVWSGTDAGGAPVASGVYFAVMRAGDVRSTQRVVLSR